MIFILFSKQTDEGIANKRVRTLPTARRCQPQLFLEGALVGRSYEWADFSGFGPPKGFWTGLQLGRE